MIDTINGANVSAIIYSIAETAKANHLKPYEYFGYLLIVIPQYMENHNRLFLKICCHGRQNFRKHIRKLS